jgi:hypothetical protein
MTSIGEETVTALAATLIQKDSLNASAKDGYRALKQKIAAWAAREFEALEKDPTSSVHRAALADVIDARTPEDTEVAKVLAERLISTLWRDENSANYTRLKHRAQVYAYAEYAFWFLAGTVISLPLLLKIIFFRYPAEGILDSMGSFVATISVWGFPLLYRQIFGSLPLEHIRGSVAVQKPGPPKGVDVGNIHAGGNVVINMSPAQAAGAIETVADLDRINSLGSAELLGLYSIASDAICKRIYARAGVYLLVGVIISFVGLGIFYLRSRDIPTGTSIIEHGLYLLPGFGVLFFVEFVALFFLRQYRSAMDEFRYFESIKRHREETLVALKICSESSAKTSIQHMLKNLNLYSGSPKLARGETTDLLESRKMQKDEIVLFEKALDLMNFVRSERSKSKSTKKKNKASEKTEGSE